MRIPPPREIRTEGYLRTFTHTCRDSGAQRAWVIVQFSLIFSNFVANFLDFEVLPYVLLRIAVSI